MFTTWVVAAVGLDENVMHQKATCLAANIRQVGARKDRREKVEMVAITQEERRKNTGRASRAVIKVTLVSKSAVTRKGTN